LGANQPTIGFSAPFLNHTRIDQPGMMLHWQRGIDRLGSSIMSGGLRFFLLVGLCLMGGEMGMAAATGPRFNEIQVMGTHNSYHIAPEPAMMQLIEQGGKGRSVSIDYTHRPLWEQFAVLGVRQIELDVYADPKGGHYSEPSGRALVKAANLGQLETHDPEGRLLKPGLKVFHVTDFDYRTTVYTFVDALKEIRDWSNQNPKHVPITVLVEVKEGAGRIGMTPAVRFDSSQFDQIDREIRDVFLPKQLITPDSIRGGFDNLRTAVLQRGWPDLEQVRGKILFALDNGAPVRDQYLEGHDSLRGRVLFVSVDANHPAAAFMKINDPVADQEKIRQAVKAGFIVRTRADSPTLHARENDVRQRELAFASGAQFVSTDYPEADVRFSTYDARLPNDLVARTNPVSGDQSGKAIDYAGVTGWQSLSQKGGKDVWENPFDWGEVDWVEGELHLRSDKNFMVASSKSYDDFVLELEAFVSSGNSGIFFRCRKGEKKLLGYQAEIDRSERQYSGGIFDNTGRGFLMPKPKDHESLVGFRERQGEWVNREGWNRYRVECFGSRIRVAINGRWVTDFVDEAHQEGVIGLQHHGGDVVYRFRNIRIREL
jgi:hypothetical protein